MMATCTNCRLPIKTKQDDNNSNSETLCGSCVTLSEGKSSIRVTPLDRDDLELLLAWRSNPEIYRYFRQQDGPLGWSEHVTWFESRKADRYDFVIHHEGRRVGVVNIDQNDEVGIYLGDFSAHGHGIATEALKWLCDRFENRAPLFAEIHNENDASERLFRQCGFRQTDGNGKWVKYVYEP